MKNTNLVPELSKELQDRLHKYMPIVIYGRKGSQTGYSHNLDHGIDHCLWMDICDYLDKNLEPKNLVHFLSNDVLEILLDYKPVKIFEMESGYTLTGKGIEVDIYRNGDYKGEGIDNIDSKLWMQIKRQLNEITSKSKVDEFAKEMIVEPEKTNVTLHELETVFNTLFNHGFHNVYELKVMTAIGLVQQIKRELKS